jgi:UDP-N-acetylglucosamine--N-acetylmuramyl-(pentapeptide) pyrophosphoryl-undecaprenol N-acetylglucosamine transferase
MKYLIATGGTGGHIFPALAVADALRARGHKVVVSSDRRGRHLIPNTWRLIPVWASGVGAKRRIFQLWSLFKICVSVLWLALRFLFRRPDRIVAFGGYASVPPLIAGRIWRIPTYLHEQNAAMGRANRFAMKFAGTLMTSFPIGVGVFTGLPVRKEFLQVSGIREQVSGARKKELRILITGGSLGAKILDETIPQALATLIPDTCSLIPLFIIHQTRPENVGLLRKEYAAMGVKNNVLSFIKNMADELAAADLVISRSGASTVAEMQAVGVPAILVPLGINPDQLANAKQFAKNGGGIVIEQKDLTPELLAATLRKLLDKPERLRKMAAAAKVPNRAVENILRIVSNEQ